MMLTLLESALIKGFDGLISLMRERDDRPRDPSQILLGKAAHPYDPHRWEEATLDSESGPKHVYIMGGTGTGKTKLIEALIRQDILAGRGFALIDPHGDLTRSILCFITRSFHPSEINELGRQLILIEPFDRQRAVGFNPLHASELPFPAILELLEIFRRFWGNTYWGPRMDEVLRNTLITLSENNLTLLEARPLLTHLGFRERLTQNVSFGEVRDYWTYRYNQLSEKMQSMYREPVLNKITAFIADPSMYRILGQRESTVDFRQAMDEGKWLLLNLSKGQLKENLRLLGALFLAKLKQAALSRIDIPEENRRPFSVYLDEFQNFLGEDIETILSESRKFRLALTLAHQTLDQLPAQLRSAILGNVGLEIFFRLSHHDATQISSELDQKDRHLIEKRLIDFKVGEAYLKIKGQKPRLLKTAHVPSLSVSEDALEHLKRASFQYWARPVNEVEREIEDRRQLWVAAETEARSPGRQSKVRLIKDYPRPNPDGLFEEGQSEW
jgi:hypothetical protein